MGSSTSKHLSKSFIGHISIYFFVSNQDLYLFQIQQFSASPTLLIPIVVLDYDFFGSWVLLYLI